MKTKDPSRATSSQLDPHEKTFQLLFCHNHVPMWVYDLTTLTFLDVNLAAMEKYGFTRNEFLEMSIQDIQPAEYNARLLDGTAKVQTAGEDFSECRHTLKDGRIIDVAMISYKVEYHKRDAILVAATDITERKRAEQALRESEQRYRALFDSSTDAICVYRDCKAIMVNPALCRLLGAENPSQLLGKSVFEFVATEFHEAVRQRTEIVMDGKTAPRMEARWVRLDGTEVDVEVTSSTLFLTGRNEILVIARNITERKRVEDALRTSEAKLSNALKIAHLGPWEYDVASDKFTFNDPFYAVFRTTAEEVGGYTMRSAVYAQRFLRPDDAPLVGAEIQKAIEATDSHYSRQFEHRIVYADGEIGYISVRFFIVKDDQGRTVRTYGVDQDITERKKMEEVLKTTIDRLHSLARQKEIIQEEERRKISLEVHDELGTGLSAIRFNLFALRDSYSKGDPEFKRKTESIIELIDGLIVTVQDISANLRPGVLDHLGIIAAIEWQTERFEAHTKIECALQLPESEPEIDSDCSITLFRILQELLTNVARHAGAKRVEVNFMESPDGFSMTVADDGVGIPEDKLNDPNSLGILGIRERLYPFGGSCNIMRLSRGGTEAKVHIPKKQIG